MEYHYRTVYCPHCNEVADKTKTVNSDWKLGSPLRNCPYCGKKYFDSFYREEGIERFKDNGVHINAWSVIWLVVSLLFVIGFLCSSDATAGAIIPGVIFVIFAIGFIRAISNLFHPQEYHQKQVELIEGRGDTMDADLAESMRRLSKREYLDELKQHGIDVPQYFYERLAKLEPVQRPRTINRQPNNNIPKNNGNEYLSNLEMTKTMLEEFQSSKPKYNENALSIYFYRIEYLFGMMRDNPNVNEAAYLDAGKAFRTIALDFSSKNDDKMSALFLIKRLQSIIGFPPVFYGQLAEDEKHLYEQNALTEEDNKDCKEYEEAESDIKDDRGEKSFFLEADNNEDARSMPADNQDTVDMDINDQTVSTLYCRKCGAKLPVDSVFCIRCGTKVVQ